jgi:HEPN domain-containing protein
MPDRERLLAVVREWVTKAENHLKTAAHTIKLGERCPTDTVCLHAQQCVEKYVKAVLVLEGTDFPKTHDLEELVVMVPERSRPTLTSEEQSQLTDYAAGARYPGWGEISLADARRALSIARRVRKGKRVAKATRPELPSWHESATDWQAGVDFLKFFSNLPAPSNCRWSQVPSDGKGGPPAR